MSNPAGLVGQISLHSSEIMPKQPQDRASARLKPSAVVDTGVIYCGDNLEQLRKIALGVAWRTNAEAH